MIVGFATETTPLALDAPSDGAEGEEEEADSDSN